MTTGAKEQLNLLYHGIAERHHQELFAEVAAWLAEMGSGGWQPVSTAPKDGTRILVSFQRGIGVREVHWACLWSDDLETNGGWHVDDLKHGPYPLRRYCDGDDTHWQPLPSPPEEQP